MSFHSSDHDAIEEVKDREPLSLSPSVLESLVTNIFEFQVLADSSMPTSLGSTLINSEAQLLCCSAETNILKSISYNKYDKALRELQI